MELSCLQDGPETLKNTSNTERRDQMNRVSVSKCQALQDAVKSALYVWQAAETHALKYGNTYALRTRSELAAKKLAAAKKQLERFTANENEVTR